MPESMPGEVRSAGAAPLILSFTQIGRGDLAQAGGKGANLGEMTRAGFPVHPVSASPLLPTDSSSPATPTSQACSPPLRSVAPMMWRPCAGPRAPSGKSC